MIPEAVIWFRGPAFSEGGCLPAWIGDTIDEVVFGMAVQVVPRIVEEIEDIRVYYTVELPGTTWVKAPRAS